MRNIKKMAEVEIFINFCSFFLFFRQVSKPIMTCLLFCEQMDALLAGTDTFFGFNAL